MEVRELTCIGCPLGCSLTVTMEWDKTGEGTDGVPVITVTGNTCPRGEAYARKEVTDPTRIVTSSVTVTGGTIAKASVKTASDIPKGKIFACMEEIRNVSVAAPVHIGDVVIENCAGTGVAVVVTKDVELA
ncbi:MAG: DUF1667 domain-containing protein [Lachnospiraceae bacterium]|nr:DUF1667 domain-containing protein [Lachnospiraceae bacterium]